MKAWKKTAALLLALVLILPMVGCSTVQSVISSIGKENSSTAGNKPAGNHAQKEDPSVAGNKPAGDHSGDTNPVQNGQSGTTSTLPDPIIDENAQPIELYGVQISKYTNRQSIVNFGNVRSDISTISVLDTNGNERILFNSGKPIKDYAATLENVSTPDDPAPVLPTNGYSFSLDRMGGVCWVYNWTDTESSAWDMECVGIQYINPGNGTNLSITDLGKPTAVYVDWTNGTTGPIRCRGVYFYWKCSGFYIEGYASDVSEVDSNGNYHIDHYNLALYDLNCGIKAKFTTAYHSLVARELGWDDVEM